MINERKNGNFMWRQNRKLFDKLWLSFFVFWMFVIEILCLLLLEPTYLLFITTVGVFFIPLISSIGVIIGLLYWFIFRFPNLKTLRRYTSDVYKNQNMTTNAHNEICTVIDKFIDEQRIKESEERVEEQKIQIEKEQFEAKLKQIEIETVKQLVTDSSIKKEEVLNNENSDFRQKVQETLKRY